MATLGLIGSGNIGSTLARLAVDACVDVVLSNSRAPQTLSGLVDELGPKARSATPAEAAAAGDWVVVTIPVGAIRTVPREPLVGKTVLDTGNYYAPRDGTIPELEARELTDSEILQRYLAEAHVVKAFNNVHYKHLRDLPRPVGAADRTALPIAGNDPGAKKHAAELLSLLGYDCVDMGPLTESWRSQVGTPVFCAPYAVTKDDQYRTQPAAPAPAAEIHPTNVDTDMIQNAGLYEVFAPDMPEAERTKENLVPRFAALTALGIPWVEPVDISNAVLWLASDESRYVTGITLPIDAGQTIK